MAQAQNTSCLSVLQFLVLAVLQKLINPTTAGVKSVSCPWNKQKFLTKGWPFAFLVRVDREKEKGLSTGSWKEVEVSRQTHILQLLDKWGRPVDSYCPALPPWVLDVTARHRVEPFPFPLIQLWLLWKRPPGLPFTAHFSISADEKLKPQTLQPSYSGRNLRDFQHLSRILKQWSTSLHLKELYMARDLWITLRDPRGFRTEAPNKKGEGSHFCTVSFFSCYLFSM